MTTLTLDPRLLAWNFRVRIDDDTTLGKENPTLEVPDDEVDEYLARKASYHGRLINVFAVPEVPVLPSIEGVEDMDLDGLRTLAYAYRVSRGGTKAAIRERLIEAVAGIDADEDASPDDSDSPTV